MFGHDLERLVEETLRQLIRYLRELNRQIRRRPRSATISKIGANDMAGPNISIAVGEVATLQARYFDGLPDANGNPTGNEIVPTVATMWSSSDPTSLSTPASIALEQATTQGLVAATGIGITITDPTSGFTFTQLADVTGVVAARPQSASITKL